MTGQVGQSDQSARPAHSKELMLPLDQTFLQFALCYQTQTKVYATFDEYFLLN
jgi:hypothetical protein